MKKRRAMRRIVLGLPALAASISTDPAAAQDLIPATEHLDAVTSLAQLIRWNGVMASAILIIAAMLLLRFTDRLVDSLSETFSNRRLLLQKFATFFRFGIYGATIISTFFLSFVVNEQVLAVMGGTVAVAMGFAVKDLVASVVAGVMIMMDRPFQVGDRVSFGGEYGDITSIGLRSVRMQTLDDNTVTIPNNKFLTDMTSCGNYGALDMQVAMVFYIGVDQDVQLAQTLVREAAATSRYIFLPKPVAVLVSQVIIENHVALRVTVKAYVLDTKYEKAFETDVNLRVLDAFRTHDIQPPAILHRTVG